MLETSQERVKLLKAGLTGKQIEKIYLKVNDFRLINGNLLFEGGSYEPEPDKA